MPSSINKTAGTQKNPSAILLSELAEMARSHNRQTRNTYHGVQDSNPTSSTTSPHSTTSSPMQSASSVPTTPVMAPGTPGTPKAEHGYEHANKAYLPIMTSSRVPSPNLSSIPSSTQAAFPQPISVGQTDVDKMMLLVQAQHKHQDEPRSPKDVPGHVFVCHVEGCGKQFRQRAHLHTHMRSHTGERPFVCPFEGCHKFFSQRCNLRTHIRSHTGERPYKCNVCGRAFSQQGNMRHHQLIHYNDHPLVCKLEDCNKQFNQLGNLKAHQNSAHKQVVHKFIERLKSGPHVDELPADEKEIFDYFCDLYKNSNRGIRGRGKGTKTIAYRGKKLSSPNADTNMDGSSANSSAETTSESNVSDSSSALNSFQPISSNFPNVLDQRYMSAPPLISQTNPASTGQQVPNAVQENPHSIPSTIPLSSSSPSSLSKPAGAPSSSHLSSTTSSAQPYSQAHTRASSQMHSAMPTAMPSSLQPVSQGSQGLGIPGINGVWFPNTYMPVNQPVNQPLSQPMNQPLNQHMNQHTAQPVSGSVGQPMNPAMGGPVNNSLTPLNPPYNTSISNTQDTITSSSTSVASPNRQAGTGQAGIPYRTMANDQQQRDSSYQYFPGFYTMPAPV